MLASFDVAIVGGGPGGTAAALTLRQAGASVLLLERRPAPIWKIGETLAPEIRPTLQSLAVWEAFVRQGHLESRGNRSVWGAEGLGETDFILNPYGCGWQLDRRQFEALLLKQAAEAGAKIRMGSGAGRIRREDRSWIIELDDGACQCAHLIDASGRGAVVARSLGINRIILDELVSVYCVFAANPNLDRDSRTLIEALPNGWFYSALMPSGKRTVAFQTDADLIPGQAWRQPAWFRTQIGQTRHLRKLLAGGDHDSDCPPSLTSAHSGRLECFCGEGWTAIGDAAMSFDPLSGQGILKAMRSGRESALALARTDRSSPEVYSHWSEDLWDAFLRNRSDYYQMEKRWPTNPFWRRRQSSVNLTVAAARVAPPPGNSTVYRYPQRVPRA